MEITFTKTYNKVTYGNGWILYSDVQLKDSKIIWILYHIVIKNTQVTFDEIYPSLKENYNNKTVKSRCDITKDENRIEVTVKGVFPRFYIEKQQTQLNNGK